jgi:hypothetical protein
VHFLPALGLADGFSGRFIQAGEEQHGCSHSLSGHDLAHDLDEVHEYAVLRMPK